MRPVIELCLDLVARIPRAPTVFGFGVFGERIAALDHESFNDAMERRAVVKTLLRERLKILNRLRRDI